MNEDGVFEDHFGGHADQYAAHRPTYPAAWFDWIAGAAPAPRAVWDCGTGTGQAARALAARFDQVFATDGSADQIGAAAPHRGVAFTVAPAEASGLPDQSVDAVTVAEALHWFDHDAFWAEVRRVARPGALFVAWGYHAHHVTPAIDAATQPFFDAVDPHWPPRRALLDRDYVDIACPFEPVPHPALRIAHDWTAEQALAYVGTWSSTARCRAATGTDPVAAVADAVREAWGPGPRTVTWTTCVVTGRVR